VASWYLRYGDWAHLRWTLLVPLQMGAAGDNVRFLDRAQNLEMLALALALPAFLLARRALVPGPRTSDPTAWLLAGCLGMTYPRGGPIHWAAAVGLVSLLLVKAILLLHAAATRWLRHGLSRRRLAWFACGVSCVLTSCGVAVLGGGDLLLGRLGGPTYFWDDRQTLRLAGIVRTRVVAGDEVLLYNVPRDTLYAIVGARFPGDLYVNTGFWDCLNKEGADERLVAALSARPDLLVLYREPDRDQAELRRTGVYRFLQERTEIEAAVDRSLSWRRVRADSAADDGGVTR